LKLSLVLKFFIFCFKIFLILNSQEQQQQEVLPGLPCEREKNHLLSRMLDQGLQGLGKAITMCKTSVFTFLVIFLSIPSFDVCVMYLLTSS